MKKRSYKITFDLKEGYAPESKVHTLSEATETVIAWMSRRLKDSLPVVSCFLQDGQLIFPSVGPYANQYPVTATPSVVLTGELSTMEDRKRTDQEIKDTLRNLALYIKQELRQQSVYIVFRDENFCI
ncbi:MAG TPA: hypothetical protein PKE30_11255 [Niabella sp.]|nr:hypothetical protein [Niabella sp.]